MTDARALASPLPWRMEREDQESGEIRYTVWDAAGAFIFGIGDADEPEARGIIKFIVFCVNSIGPSATRPLAQLETSEAARQKVEEERDVAVVEHGKWMKTAYAEQRRAEKAEATVDQARQYLVEKSGIGAGDDPVGVLIAAHNYVVQLKLEAEIKLRASESLKAGYIEALQKTEAEVARRNWVIEAASLFIKEGTRLTVCDRGSCQQVIEKADRSDPQAQLIRALKALASPAMGEKP